MPTASAADAQIVMQLYDLRRESELRKAGNWFGQDFNPTSADDIIKVAMDRASDANRYYRMVLGYWDMAASIALRGAVDKDLFTDNAGEMFFIYAKLEPYLKEVREKLGMPGLCARLETLINQTEGGPQRVKGVQAMIAKFRDAAKK